MGAEKKIRVLVAKPGLDGHDRGARVVAAALRDAGYEVIYSGLRASVDSIATAAVQEDVDVIGLSVLSGAHESICRKLLGALSERGADIPVIVGGVIPEKDVEPLAALGVKAVFGPETPLPHIVEAVRQLAEGRPLDEARPSFRTEPAKLIGLDHVAVCVGDLDEATRVFEKVFGLRPSHREYVAEQRTEAVFFDLGSTSIELVAPRAGNTGLEKFLEKRGPGLHHVALQVEGLAAGLDVLRARGLPLIDAEPRRGAREHRVAFLHPKAVGGVLVELVEHTDSKVAQAPVHRTRSVGGEDEALGAGGDPRAG